MCHSLTLSWQRSALRLRSELAAQYENDMVRCCRRAPELYLHSRILVREPCLILQKVHFRLSWVPQKHLCLSSLFTGFLAYERRPGERSYISERTKTDRGSMEGWRKRSKCVVDGGKVLWKACKIISRKWKLVETPYFHVLTSSTYKSRNSRFLSLIRIVTKCSNETSTRW